jgi:hypothetical protein
VAAATFTGDLEVCGFWHRARGHHCRIICHPAIKAGWSWRCVSAVDSEGRTIWIADAPRDNGKRFVRRADEKLTAVLELEAAVTKCSELA